MTVLKPDINVVCHVHGSFIISASVMLKPDKNSLPLLTPGFVFNEAAKVFVLCGGKASPIAESFMAEVKGINNSSERIT